MRFYLRRFVYEVIPGGCLIVILDHRVVDHRSGVEIIDNGGSIDICDSYHAVIVYGVNRCLRYDYGCRHKRQAANRDGRGGRCADNDCRRTPVVVRIVDLSRGQRDPTDIRVSAYPGDPSRIPAKSDGGADCDSGGRGRRRPVPSVTDQQPVAIMVSNVSERLIGYPDLILVIVRPSADRKGLPI